MEDFPVALSALDGWLLYWAKRIGIWTLRGLEIIVSGIGAVLMLVVIGIIAIYDFMFG